MDNILEIIQAILRPLEGGILFAAILAGLSFGYFYNKRLKLPASLIYHKWVAAAVFLVFVAVARLLITGQVQPAGYVGVALLWGLYCIFIYIGSKINLKRILCIGRAKRSTKTSRNGSK